MQDQQKRRRGVVLHDQWGRKYHATMDKATGDSVGPIRPDFEAVVGLPDSPQHWRHHPEHPAKIDIRYPGWIGELRAARQAWQADLERYARNLYGEKAGDALKNRPPELLNLAGGLPFPYELVEAASQGNKWILGLRAFDVKNPADQKLKRILDTYQAASRVTAVPLEVNQWAAGDVTEPSVA